MTSPLGIAESEPGFPKKKKSLGRGLDTFLHNGGKRENNGAFGIIRARVLDIIFLPGSFRIIFDRLPPPEKRTADCRYKDHRDRPERETVIPILSGARTTIHPKNKNGCQATSTS